MNPDLVTPERLVKALDQVVPGWRREYAEPVRLLRHGMGVQCSTEQQFEQSTLFRLMQVARAVLIAGTPDA